MKDEIITFPYFFVNPFYCFFNLQPLAEQHRSLLPCIAGETRGQPCNREHCVIINNDQDVFVLLLEEVVYNCHRLVAVATLCVHCEWQNLNSGIFDETEGEHRSLVIEVEVEPLLDDLHLRHH